MYRAALRGQWSHVALRCTTHPEEALYVHPTNGLTTLHQTLISRLVSSKGCAVTSENKYQRLSEIYGTDHDNSQNPASVDVIRSLLAANPNACQQRCRTLGYTPLAYACLVPPYGLPEISSKTIEDKVSTKTNMFDGKSLKSAAWGHRTYPERQSDLPDEFILGVSGHDQPEDLYDEAEVVVRMLLEMKKEAVSVTSSSGMSPVDIHISSYSQARGNHKAATNDKSKKVASSTSILRALLEVDPALARPSKSSPVGPLEILYKCNAPIILNAVDKATKVKISSENKAISSLKELSNMWVWGWTIMLLRYGTMHLKKRGTQFSALHAAAMTEGCPLPIIMLAVRAFPSQIKQGDQMTETSMLPLQLICCWGRTRHPHPKIVSRKGAAISALLKEYYEAAEILEPKRLRSTLSLALGSNTTWEGGLRELVKANPAALLNRDTGSRLPPFLFAASRAGQGFKAKTSKEDDAQLSTVYELLRASPRVLDRLLPANAAIGLIAKEYVNSWVDFSEFQCSFASPNADM
jgi:hypothetical protein